MRLAAELERQPGVDLAAAVMATPANLELLQRSGLQAEPGAGPNDLLVAVRADDEAALEAALAHAERTLRGSGPSEAGAGTVAAPAARTIADAIARLPGANLALISTPGTYATAEALKALKRGLHVFLFSDNVALDDEVMLKQLATRKRLLLMGPDCGTAILDGVPLGFANAVRRGRIGLVGASGTGLQQVGCLIDRLGEGVSQLIGVGSHDLSEQVGGLMMRAGIERLAEDPETAVVVLVSKPPAPAIARQVLATAVEAGKPVVVSFLGGDRDAIRSTGAIPAATLEQTAALAVALARGQRPETVGDSAPSAELLRRVDDLAADLAPGQRGVLGLYSGGTLAQEAALLLGAVQPALETSVLDLGDDEFTVGRPHPMIDFRLRNERIVAAAEDPHLAVVLLDVVLGYGSHPDPAGALEPALEQARARAEQAGRRLLFIGSVCGAAADPQDPAAQEARLAAAGVLLAPSNAQAAHLAARAVAGRGG
jgi:succinyl-CoA synthetase alpha subunit